jgi:hypothetical protein
MIEPNGKRFRRAELAAAISHYIIQHFCGGIAREARLAA